MNQSLLIVDDEYDILTWLEELFRYEFDMEIDVYTASSALEALELLDRVRFDVVLTDIRMPGMDGIALFRRIKSNWPRCKTVFLTGFRNFDDMYQIVNHRDVRYLLKSEDDEVIMQTVRESLNEIRMDMEKESQKKQQKEEMDRLKFWMNREFMEDLFMGKYADHVDKAKQRAEELAIPIDFRRKFLLFLLRLDGKERNGEESTSVLKMSARLIRENAPEDMIVYLHPQERGQAALLLQSETEEAEWERFFAVSRGAVEYAQDILRSRRSGSFSAVIESTPISLAHLPKTAAELRQIMVGYMGEERDLIAHKEQLEEGMEQDNSADLIHKVPLLKSYLELRRRQEYFEILAECGKELAGIRSQHDTRAMELYYSISVLLLQFINENGLNEKMAFHVGLYKLTKADEHTDWSEAADYLFQVSSVVFRLLGDNGNMLADRALNKICNYIDENLSGDLSLTRLADVGGFNSSYLSRLFKQMQGINIREYVSQRRMELAKKLLTETDKKVQEIAAETGYISAHSFARSFRSTEGLSPAEYRQLHRNG